MDPDETLKRILELADRLPSESRDLGHATDDVMDLDNDACQLAELVLALDEWMKNGGFLPKRWQINWQKP